MTELTKSLGPLQHFTFEITDNYFKQKGRLLKHMEKGYKYFVEGYIHDLWVTNVSNINVFFVKAKCYKSQRKNDLPHCITIEFMQNGGTLEVRSCNCSCEAGASESCQHLVALGYTLQHLVLKGFTEIPEDLSSTSVAQQWSVPRGQKILPEPVMSVAFVNVLKSNRKKNPVVCDLYEARSSSMKQMKITDIETAKKNLMEIDARIPLSYLLPSSGISHNESLTFQDIPEEAVIFHHLNNYRTPAVQPELVNNNDDNIRFPIITLETEKILSSNALIMPDNISKTLEECYNTEVLTRGQASSILWKQEKKLRFTASNFGLLAKRKRQPTAKFISNILNGVDISYIPAIKHGINKEDAGRLKYIQEMKTVQVYRCGLVINPLAPYLGASPDGHVVDSTLLSNQNGLLEIKCPYSRKFGSLEDALNCNDFYCEKINNQIKLKQNVNYFYQVQGQMLLCGVNWCDFVVYFSETNEILIDRVQFDYDFCFKMFKKLSVMFNAYALPLLKEDENKENKL